MTVETGENMIPKYTSITSVLESTNRIPFTNSDGAQLIAYLKTAAKNGLDITGHPAMKESIQETMGDGIIALTSAALDADFVVIKVDGGRGLFGKQKSHFMFYAGQIESDELMPGKYLSKPCDGADLDQ